MNLINIADPYDPDELPTMVYSLIISCISSGIAQLSIASILFGFMKKDETTGTEIGIREETIVIEETASQTSTPEKPRKGSWLLMLNNNEEQ
jgi:hypothetical protein